MIRMSTSGITTGSGTKPEKECEFGCKGVEPGHTHPDQVMTKKGE